MKAAFYKSTRAGWSGLYNRLVRWWTCGPYSHVELIFSDGMAASSSFMDRGVRFKQIDFDPARWDVVELPASLEAAARVWFMRHAGQPYDLLGNLHFVIAPVRNDHDAWFCSEAVAAALGMSEPWRFDPNSLAAALRFVQQPECAHG